MRFHEPTNFKTQWETERADKLEFITLSEYPEAGSLNKSSCLAPTLGVTKFIIVTGMILVTLCCAT
jgi:hypothetical protein